MDECDWGWVGGEVLYEDGLEGGGGKGEAAGEGGGGVGGGGGGGEGDGGWGVSPAEGAVAGVELRKVLCLWRAWAWKV